MTHPSFTPAQEKRLKGLEVVQSVYLFGSRAFSGEVSKYADYDYAILTSDRGHTKGDDLYFQLYDLLSDISPRTLENDVIDIIFLRDAGLELRFHVIRYGIVLISSFITTRIFPLRNSMM